MVRYISILLLYTAVISATVVIPISKTKFKIINSNQTKIVNLSNKEFIVVSLRERGADGRFYAVKDGAVWLSGAISSGAYRYKTPSGVFKVLRKKRYHMSHDYPSADGVNNMNYSIFFTHRGHALHEGSPEWMSHGCIHIDKADIIELFDFTKVDYTYIVVTQKSYMKYAREDLLMMREF